MSKQRDFMGVEEKHTQVNGGCCFTANSILQHWFHLIVSLIVSLFMPNDYIGMSLALRNSHRSIFGA